MIKDYAEDNGIIAGLCDCRRLFTADENELKQAPFVTSNIQRRLEPSLGHEWARSIIVIGVGYKKLYEGTRDDLPRGRISQSAVGVDYHILVRQRLESLAAYIASSAEYKYKIFVDTGDLNERSLAVAAGLGYVGRNRAVISKKLGSMFNIGYMLTDLELFPGACESPKVSKACPDSCTLCVDSCPGGALTADCGVSKFDYRKCVSYLTQSKSVLTADEMNSIEDWIYGCDICQTVCPENKNIEAEIIRDIDLLYPALDSIINMNDDDFKGRFGISALYWRGRKIIIRNAENALKFIRACSVSNI